MRQFASTSIGKPSMSARDWGASQTLSGPSGAADSGFFGGTIFFGSIVQPRSSKTFKRRIMIGKLERCN